ncbi:MAG: sigma-54 dependent transcriptional regulator [Polyangiaceae bacterium]|nr:sigma-54 dependent transcriptional regulator [Polyangiaceae bacterium]
MPRVSHAAAVPHESNRGSAAPKLEAPKTPSGSWRLGTVRQFGRVGARSSAMHEVFDALERFVGTDVSITLIGETGVGKDVLAHGIHELSRRAGGPLVVFDCGSVAANLAESELLGHEKGAFTGAVSGHPGAFERAHGGTLFLDEVGELPLDLQSRLLRALDSRRVRRVGGKADRRVDVRIVAATNRDLRADVASGRFREDLFFRLAVAVVAVPSLRNRIEDLPDLVYGLLADLGRPALRVSDAAFERLRDHSWPGNVRELKNALACAVAFVDPEATHLEPHHLRLLGATAPDAADWANDLPLAGQPLERIERAAIRQTLVLSKGSKVEAARILGIAASTLYEKLRKYGL